MKIRSITVGIDPGRPLKNRRIEKAGRFAVAIARICEEEGIEVQTRRLCTPPLRRCVSGLETKAVIQYGKDLEQICLENGFEYCAMGRIDIDRASELEVLRLVPELIGRTHSLFTSVAFTDASENSSLESAKTTADIIRKISTISPNGFDNLRFAAGVFIRPHTPFFPVAFHAGRAAYAIALEAADVVTSAVTTTDARSELVTGIRLALERRLKPLQVKLQKFDEGRYRFAGFDLSPAPSPGADASIARAIEKISGVPFGMPGTLAAASLVTTGVKTASVNKCGYCGLMLPVLEDSVLASANDRSNIGLSELLSYSAICGTGLDTIPLPGKVSQSELVGIVLDVTALGRKLRKPLSVRLLPVPGKSSGETTEFDFPFFVNSRVMDPKR